MTQYTVTLLPALRISPTLRTVCLALGFAMGTSVWANDPAPTTTGAEKPAAAASAPVKAASKAGRDMPEKAMTLDNLPTKSGNVMAEKIRAALSGTTVVSKKMTVTVEDNKDDPAPRMATPAVTATPAAPARRAGVSQHNKPARTANAVSPAATDANTHGGEAHWSYEGETGPQAWGKLKPDFTTCATGKRQSPINIEDGSTLQGPAEPVQFAYAPSNGTVVNNGHTIQVDVRGENTITVRGSTYRLLQFHFHTPSEEQINSRRFPMVAHLVHKNSEGQLAVVAVLLDEGAANPLIDKVWTYMPLDANDRVRMPQDLLNVSELLPTDQRYYQFMGSLTTPPCSEGVLWMVLKQPVTISTGQHKLFTQLYPNNARPVQPVNARPVREAQ